MFKTEWKNMVENLKIYFPASVFIMLLGIALKFSIDPKSFRFGFYLTQFPLFFLLLFYPLTTVFRKIFKKEPEITRHGSFSDLIYSMLLLLGAFLLPMLLDIWIVNSFLLGANE